jgi:protein-serine/threonine kinase
VEGKPKVVRRYSGKLDYESLFVPIKKLGEGSFGRVYLVKQKGTGKHYAMKVLSKSKVYQNNISKYILTERKVQSIIKSRFIVRTHCAFQIKSKLFMIMDYCPGGDLRAALKTNHKFTESQAKIYAAEVLLALEQLHKQSVIHRDLKLDNVVLDKNGHALLTDFGLSKQGVKLEDSTDTFCGTMQYLAPEILEGLGHGRSVDWYLFGTFLYEMIVGYPPFFDSNKYA